MADYSGALKKFRESGYPEDKGGDEQPESSGVRNIKLTDDEVKELQPYQEKFGTGQEMVIEATGEMEGNTFRITGGVKYSTGGGAGDEKQDVNADAEEMMSKFRQGPMTQSQTIPSPS